ncbi:unnamed protein product [Rotaria sordida]|uniref:Autophagy-related protein 13 n=1 Tax=Rotaria sordida TaxID=392033 RepID=A0A819LAW1_9BILA|nr:unnamed protein product [Rotaria sordida]CAF0942284.1 unnamed protein product [Rotaria sordida]CAF3782107.1 unnamed protein product [Rotaria sordida]CAF3963227.1 unnamed protein product [Rotaria sordida]
MTNIENKTNHWCELVTSEFILPTIKTCVTINESLSNLDDQTIINEWIDRSIAITNCSYYLLSSMTISQKRILTIVQSILLFILFLPFIFELSLTIIQYYMTDYQLSNDDHEALEKFTKFFLVKAAQIIVQSRLGEKKTTKSKPVYSGSEWFHLSIKDIPEVTVNAKKCLGDAQHLLINPPHSPFCVEISLRTPDGDTITLETWCISFDDSIFDPAQRVRFNVYNRMSVVLRSLVACTRATPTYQLSRKQSADKYIICYKMYSGEPIVSHLGEHYSKKTIGSIVTPIGRFVLNVAYRTCLTMSSPQMDSGTSSAMTQFGMDIRDDHFSLDRNQHSVEEDSDAQLPSAHNSSVPKSSPIEVTKRRHTSCDSVSSSHGTPDKVYYSKLRAAFATPGTTAHPSHMSSYTRTNDNDLPFVLMMQQQENTHQQQHLMEQDQPQEQNSKNNYFLGGDSENETAPDDFILVEVKPFFGKSDSTDDLALFIRSCQQPPMLESFVVEPSLGETINQLNEELRIFESKVEEFDQLVSILDMNYKASSDAAE